MKYIFVSMLAILFCTLTMAQTIGSKVSLTAVDGKNYTGTITDIQGNKYKVKYDGVDFDAWLTTAQFTVTNANTQPVNPINAQATQQKNNGYQIG